MKVNFSPENENKELLSKYPQIPGYPHIFVLDSGGNLLHSQFTGDLEEMSLLAGESVGQTKRLMSAASIIDEMMNGAEAVIRERLGSMVVD